MTAEQYLEGLYAVRMENIEKVLLARALNPSAFCAVIGRHRSFIPQLKSGQQFPTERAMRTIEHAFGFAYDSMDSEDFKP